MGSPWWLRLRAAVVKVAFEAGRAVTPPVGHEVVAASVDVVRDLVVDVPGEPPAALDVYRPRAGLRTPLPLVLWIHGGGFLSGTKEQVGPYLTMLAAQGYVVASLGYALAPQHRYPTAIRQANAAADHLVRHAAELGADPGRVFFGGDSAGAQLASQLAAIQTDPALAAALSVSAAVAPPHLRGVVLCCGIYDLRTVGASGFPALRTLLWSYTGRRDWTRWPRVDELSATEHLSPDYPPVFLTVGDADPFQGQGLELVAALKRHGVPTRTVLWAGSGRRLPHEYQFDFRRPEAAHAFAATVEFLRDLATAGEPDDTAP